MLFLCSYVKHVMELANLIKIACDEITSVYLVPDLVGCLLSHSWNTVTPLFCTPLGQLGTGLINHLDQRGVQDTSLIKTINPHLYVVAWTEGTVRSHYKCLEVEVSHRREFHCSCMHGAASYPQTSTAIALNGHNVLETSCNETSQDHLVTKCRKNVPV